MTDYATWMKALENDVSKESPDDSPEDWDTDVEDVVSENEWGHFVIADDEPENGSFSDDPTAPLVELWNENNPPQNTPSKPLKIMKPRQLVSRGASYKRAIVKATEGPISPSSLDELEEGAMFPMD